MCASIDFEAFAVGVSLFLFYSMFRASVLCEPLTVRSARAYRLSNNAGNAHCISLPTNFRRRSFSFVVLFAAFSVRRENRVRVWNKSRLRLVAKFTV